MTDEQQKVLRFHLACGLKVRVHPGFPEEKVIELRKKLIFEEWQEFASATNIIEAADALADLLYVIYGAAVSYGIDLKAVFDEVHYSNMTKLNAEGHAIKNADGKVMKGPFYRKPNIEKVLEMQPMLQIFASKKD